MFYRCFVRSVKISPFGELIKSSNTDPPCDDLVNQLMTLAATIPVHDETGKALYA
jgi:hypothetical protein